MATDVSRTRSIPPSQIVRVVVIALLVIALVAFAIDNAQDVEVGWVFGSGQLALWVVITVSALAGALIGYFAGRRHHR